METQRQLIESLACRTEELAATTAELIKLKVVDTSIKISSGILTGLIIGVLAASCVLFLSMSLALWLGKWIGEVYLGFVCVAAFYAILTLIGIIFIPKKLERVIGRLIIQKAYQQP